MTARPAVIAAAASLALFASLAVAATVSVEDGDSLVLDGRHVEIWGIIAPQKSETCTTTAGAKWPCGQRAFEQLSEAAADPSFSCETKEEGFVVCHAGGMDVGLLMVKEGLARARQAYGDVEARAREAKTGLWE